MSKCKYVFSRCVMVNGVAVGSVDWRGLTVGDLRAVNKLQGGNQVVAMVAKACGVAPDDVRGFKTRDFTTLRKLIVGDVADDGDEVEAAVYEVDENEEIVVELLDPIVVGEGGEPYKSVTVSELTTDETLKAEKLAKGNDFELIYHRVLASLDVSADVLNLMSKRDFGRVGAAVSVFFSPVEQGAST